MIEIIKVDFGTPEFDACMAIRIDVFVKEQNVPPDEESDALDNVAMHFLALVAGKPAGTARAVEKSPGVWKIGRVAVRPEYRDQSVGRALMCNVEAACPASHFTLSAQAHALKFYEKLGYRTDGEKFFEAGMPHYVMIKAASAS